MNTQIIAVDFPSDILLTLNKNENELKQDIKLSLAIRLYKLQKLTIGKAAQVAGLSRLEFETALSDNEIPISNLTIDDGLVIADAGPIFSLAVIDRMDLLDSLFDDVKISSAVWVEISKDEKSPLFQRVYSYFQDKVVQIKGFNELTFVMDYGESESIILYKELEADFLLIDDKKARSIAENFGINCIGTISLLPIAKDKGLIESLRPLFEMFLQNHRYYSIELLNSILHQKGEDTM